MMKVDTLTDCDDRKCKRPKGMVGGVTNERRYRERWIKAFEDYLHLSKRDGWYLKKLQDLQEKMWTSRSRKIIYKIRKVSNCFEVCVVKNELITLILAGIFFTRILNQGCKVPFISSS